MTKHQHQTLIRVKIETLHQKTQSEHQNKPFSHTLLHWSVSIQLVIQAAEHTDSSASVVLQSSQLSQDGYESKTEKNKDKNII